MWFIHSCNLQNEIKEQRKPEEKVIRVWSSDSVETLKACFDCTVWEEFHHHGSLDETSTVTTDYIDFCVQTVIPTKEIQIYPNNKMHINMDIKHTMNLRKIAFKNRDTIELKRVERDLRGRLREAKRGRLCGNLFSSVLLILT